MTLMVEGHLPLTVQIKHRYYVSTRHYWSLSAGSRSSTLVTSQRSTSCGQPFEVSKLPPNNRRGTYISSPFWGAPLRNCDQSQVDHLCSSASVVSSRNTSNAATSTIGREMSNSSVMSLTGSGSGDQRPFFSMTFPAEQARACEEPLLIVAGVPHTSQTC